MAQMMQAGQAPEKLVSWRNVGFVFNLLRALLSISGAAHTNHT